MEFYKIIKAYNLGRTNAKLKKDLQILKKQIILVKTIPIPIKFDETLQKQLNEGI